jgi:hypothetical protein
MIFFFLKKRPNAVEPGLFREKKVQEIKLKKLNFFYWEEWESEQCILYNILAQGLVAGESSMKDTCSFEWHGVSLSWGVLGHQSIESPNRGISLKVLDHQVSPEPNKKCRS